MRTLKSVLADQSLPVGCCGVSGAEDSLHWFTATHHLKTAVSQIQTGSKQELAAKSAAPWQTNKNTAESQGGWEGAGRHRTGPDRTRQDRTGRKAANCWEAQAATGQRSSGSVYETLEMRRTGEIHKHIHQQTTINTLIKNCSSVNSDKQMLISKHMSLKGLNVVHIGS